jgi:hypothetical protein
MNEDIKNTEQSQINDPMLCHKLLKKQQATPKTKRRRETLNIRTEINKIETTKTMPRIKETKS